MPLDLIIDGYNVLHFAGLARTTYGPGGLERARERLLKRLAKGMTAAEHSRTTVVFDAQSVAPGESRRQVFKGLQIIYSPHGKEADDVIEDLIERHASPRQLVVVSSDNRLISAARRRKATAILSEVFLDELDSRATEPVVEHVRAPEKPEPELTAEELAKWMDQFSEVEHSHKLVEPLRQPLQPPVRTTPPPPPAKTKSANTLAASTSPAVPPPTRPDVDEPTPLLAESANADLIAELEAELQRCLKEGDLKEGDPKKGEGR